MGNLRFDALFETVPAIGRFDAGRVGWKRTRERGAAELIEGRGIANGKPLPAAERNFRLFNRMEVDQRGDGEDELFAVTAFRALKCDFAGG